MLLVNNTQARRLRLRQKTLEFGTTHTLSFGFGAMLTVIKGIKERTPLSRIKIREFVKFYHIKMEDFEPSEIDDYPVGSPHDAELIAADVESKDFRGLLRKKHKPGKSTWRMIRYVL